MLKKKRLIIFGLFLCLFFLIKIDVQAENVKGDLRCPQNHSANVDCVPTQWGADGKPYKVELTWTENVGSDSWMKVKKIVSKTDTTGKYNVKFQVAAKNLEIKQTTTPTYIAFILDFSLTARAQQYNIVNAVKKFALDLIPPENNGTSRISISLIAFGSNLKVVRGLDNKNFKGIDIISTIGNVGDNSNIELAFEEAYNQLKNREGNKYVVVLGDGRYTMKDGEQTNVAAAENWSDKLRNKLGAQFIIARYPSYDEALWYNKWDYFSGCKEKHPESLKAAKIAGCVEAPVEQCNLNTMMRFLTGDYCLTGWNDFLENAPNCSWQTWRNCKWWPGEKDVANYYYMGNPEEYSNILTKIANKIIENVGATNVVSELTDGIGPEFYLYDGDLRYQKFEIEHLTEEWQKVGEFDIEIDPFADSKSEVDDGLEEGWHKTNSNFTFSYTNSEGEEKKYNVKDNPEVYWVPNKTTLDSCYDSAQVDTVREKGDGDEDGIYSKVCREGFDDKFGFRVVANVNNFSGNPSSDLNKKFTLTSTMGYKFPASITLSTNLICTYRFDVNKYNEKYNELSSEIQNAEGKEKISLEKKLDNLVKVKDHYVNDVLPAQDLYNYRDDFNNQTATLKVDYPGTAKDDEISFVNVGTPTNNEPNCVNNATDKIDGKTIVTHRTCTVSFTKDMQLPNACLNMQTGEEENCSTEVAQIAGGNNFYLKLNETGGKITINVPKAGYGKKLDFTMDKDSKGGNSCYVYTDNTNNDGKIDFRPIDLDNPFLTNYNRKVGRNYLNDRFDFEKVIHDDTATWDKEPEYDYYMSKTNITKIINDSNEDPKRSYLGKECYFTSSGLYKCKFTQNETKNGNDNSGWWFFKVDGSKIK